MEEDDCGCQEKVFPVFELEHWGSSSFSCPNCQKDVKISLCTECYSIRNEFKAGNHKASNSIGGDDGKTIQCSTCKLQHYQYEDDRGDLNYIVKREYGRT